MMMRQKAAEWRSIDGGTTNTSSGLPAYPDYYYYAIVIRTESILRASPEKRHAFIQVTFVTFGSKFVHTMRGKFKPVTNKRKSDTQDDAIKHAKTELPEDSSASAPQSVTSAKGVMTFTGPPPVILDSVFVQNVFLAEFAKVKVVRLQYVAREPSHLPLDKRE